jgi:hypothetical protein
MWLSKKLFGIEREGVGQRECDAANICLRGHP